MTTRRVFISYEGSDRMKAKGFRLLRWNKNVDVEFQDRHLLDPVDSTNRGYIQQCIRDEIKGTSTTVVLVGENTKDSDWVDYEIERSLKDGNGLVAIKVDDNITDEDVPDKLKENGAEIVDWNPDEFADAIDRAASQRSKVGESTVRGRAGAGCGRS
ncbi:MULTISPECIES: TIR domain-containing protein [Halorussus]|uniref:TIR domain-containing protein n=1 Tax=Halorussus TaxID=1070314 RepID=UPI000E218AF5|nr:MULTISPECIES: TIR domain-containing protein [Halorussus]NHN60052.1 TIR domain-containing protein [Halorussus sp. JP-T4]